ncbi:MAG: ubiquinol-cytochrome c reductase iron-sulfur subunit [bacterium]
MRKNHGEMKGVGIGERLRRRRSREVMRYQSAAICALTRDVTAKKACFWNFVFRSTIILIILVPLIYTAVRYMHAPQNAGRNLGYIPIPLSSLPEGTSQLVLYQGHPIIIINNHGNIKALSALCTINESILHWDQAREELVCPTHGARFDLNGNVKSGLAPRPLDRFHVSFGEDVIIVGGLL